MTKRKLAQKEQLNTEAMDDERYEEKVPEISFIEQAYAYVDDKYKEAENITDRKYGPGLNPWDHKVLIGVMDMHVQHVYDILVENYSRKIAQHYDPIMATLKRLEEKQDIFKDELIRISNKENEDVKRLEEKIMAIVKRQDEKKKRIENLEKVKFNLDNLSRAGEIVMSFKKQLNLIIYLTISGFVFGGIIMIGHLFGWW